MKLYLMKHGEAQAKDVDPERPLTGRGRAFLAAAGVRAQRVIHSGKLRAAQTAECLARSLAPGVELEVSGLINPNDSPKAFDWQSDSWDRDTLVVGHLPFLARLVSHLLLGDEDRPFTAYRPGSIVCLGLQPDGGWQIDWMLRPDLFGDGVQR